jgi:epoxyqueuosine reductase
VTATLKSQLLERAKALGFGAVGVASAQEPWSAGERLRQFIALDHHAGMGWLTETIERRAHPTALWPQARTAIMLATSYAPPETPLPLLKQRERGVVSVYAARKDYHDVVKGRLKELAGWLAATAASDVKVFVDTAPLMEKPLAARAGLGWQGKHTNLVSREHGSWLFLGAILTQAELPPDEPEQDLCGSCTACLDICPTAAFPAPYQLDARRCIAYLTIEHDGPIPEEHRPAIGNRIFGCDDCLAVCPWNKFAAASQDQKLSLRDDLQAQNLVDLAALDEPAFRTRFAGTPVKRTGRNRFVRNVAIALGNAEGKETLAAAHTLLDDPSPLVRGAAIWALRRRLDAPAFQRLKESRAVHEPDPQAAREWGA